MRKPVSELEQVNSTIKKLTSTLRSTVVRSTAPLVGESIAAKAVRLMENEGFKNAPKSYRDATMLELMNVLTNERRIAAGVAMHNLTLALGPFSRDVLDTIEATRHDVALTWPDAFDRLDNAGMLSAGVYRELRRSFVDEASSVGLLDIEERAIEERLLATSRIDGELIEARLDRGGLAKSEQDLPASKKLRQRVEGLRELRVDPALEAMKESIEEGKKAISRARLISIAPVDLETQLPDVQQVVERELQEAAA